jgi:hypothetical protein
MAAAILGGVVLAALGRAGEMATFAGDTAPIELEEVTAADVALLRPPMSLWGYNVQATEDALRVIARSVTARDVEIATLRKELAELRGDPEQARAGPVRGAGPAGGSGPVHGAGHARNTGPVHGAGPARNTGPVRGAGPVRNTGPAVPPAGQVHRAEPPGQPPWPRRPGPGPDE